MSFCRETLTADEHFMALALKLAEKGRGYTAPNPCVGAVMVADGQVVAEGWHKKYGGLHAERECLADASKKGIDPGICTMYVTLEPCNHHGKTPPCTEGILEAGIPRVVIGAMDPNPKVDGGGAARLERDGVHVTCGVLDEACQGMISDFKVWISTARPYVILKLAATLDGKIAGPAGIPEAVSSSESRHDVQTLRFRSDAVLVGGNTLYNDDPSLTCRLEDLPGDYEQPLAVVATTRLPGTEAGMVRARPHQVVFLTSEEASQSQEAGKLKELGCAVVGLPQVSGGLDFKPGFEWLRREKNCHTILCEGGGRLGSSLVDQGLVDEVVYYLAPRVLGNAEGISSFSGLDVKSMEQTKNFRVLESRMCGPDIRIRLKPVSE